MVDGHRDPIEVRSDDSEDLYEIADWEVRSRFDWLAWLVYTLFLYALKVAVVLVAVGIFLSQFVLGGYGALTNPVVGGFVALSALPALALAAYVWYTDVTTKEPVVLLAATFILAFLFAGFAGIVNSEVGPTVQTIASGYGVVPMLGTVVYYFVVVGPIEETVKLLSIRLAAYQSIRFDAVIDGAVYGAVAGLGFATIENALYIAQNATGAITTANAIAEAGDITFLRSIAGPGHVIYSAFAGYYLGLAKFNREHAGPIVVKGLLIAIVIHAGYNTLIGIVPGSLSNVTGMPLLAAFFVFVLAYNGAFGYILLRKFRSYQRAYVQTQSTGPPSPEGTDLDS